MPPHNLPATDDVPLRKNTIIDRCKEVVSSISQKGNRTITHWLRILKITNQHLLQCADNSNKPLIVSELDT